MTRLRDRRSVGWSATIDACLDDYRDWIPSIVDIDLAEVLAEPERVDISLPKRLIRRLDAQA